MVKISLASLNYACCMWKQWAYVQVSTRVIEKDVTTDKQTFKLCDHFMHLYKEHNTES
jgi:hypothetical protein